MVSFTYTFALLAAAATAQAVTLGNLVSPPITGLTVSNAGNQGSIDVVYARASNTYSIYGWFLDPSSASTAAFQGLLVPTDASTYKVSVSIPTGACGAWRFAVNEGQLSQGGKTVFAGFNQPLNITC